jgi:hypothetical protein
MRDAQGPPRRTEAAQQLRAGAHLLQGCRGDLLPDKVHHDDVPRDTAVPPGCCLSSFTTKPAEPWLDHIPNIIPGF